MPKHRWSLVSVLIIIATLGPLVVSSADAQLSDTTAFLANLSNQYRVVPDIVYHTACITPRTTTKTGSTSTCPFAPKVQLRWC